MEKRTHGFTLIELIVVITLIGLISSIVGIAISGVQKKSRDKKRKEDIAQIQNALELYKIRYGLYPEYTSADEDIDFINKASDLTARLVTSPNIYLVKIPLDPMNGSNCKTYLYLHNDTRDKYTLFTDLESTSDSDATKVKETPVATGGQVGDCSGSGGICTEFQVHGGRTVAMCGPGSPATMRIYNYWVNSPN